MTKKKCTGAILFLFVHAIIVNSVDQLMKNNDNVLLNLSGLLSFCLQIR